MKRKVAATSITLAAALVLAACGSAEPDDPLSGLSGGNASIVGSSSSNATNGNEEEDSSYVADIFGEKSPVDVTVEETDPSEVEVFDDEVEGQKLIEEYEEGNHIMGVNPDSINVPDYAENHFAEDAEIADVSRVVRDALLAVDMGVSNITFQAEVMDNDQVPFAVDYVSDFMSSEGLDKFEHSLSDEEDANLWVAWFILPFRPMSEEIPTTNDGKKHKIASPELNWHATVSDVEINDVIIDRKDGKRDAVVVGMKRDYYVPVEDGNKAVTAAINFNLTMVPDGHGKWIISDWFTNGMSDLVLIDVED